MLNQLDTLIGFAVVMAVVSLLITIVTQMVSAGLGLRGKYLADALETMIHKIDPTINDQVHDLGEQLAKWILTHPVLSDSGLPMSPNGWDQIPLIAWLRRRWRIASAIRPDELFQILQDVAGVSPNKALEKHAELEVMAALAREALVDQKKREEASKLANDRADKMAEEEKKAKEAAIAAAQDAARNQDPKAKVAASRDAAPKTLVAQNAAKVTTQAKEIAKKARDAVGDVAKAKEFAVQAAMRAAAAKLLSGLYVPSATQTVPAEDVTSAVMIKEIVEEAKRRNLL
jgi:hypothetical protein